MDFPKKADYGGPCDADGIPLLNYHGSVGLQYNPIAIAQFGLGNFNLWRATGDEARIARCLKAANWLVASLERNAAGLAVWNHHFNWEYREGLRAPWYSGLAQGQGISTLLRAYLATSKQVYLDAANRAFECFHVAVEHGGVLYAGPGDDVWIEEYMVDPASHILNGCIWALWGVYDFALLTADPWAWQLFSIVSKTIARRVGEYDAGFWSLYEKSNVRVEMLASAFYHALHIVQLRILYKLTHLDVFHEYAERWEQYRSNDMARTRAFLLKGLFKLVYY